MKKILIGSYICLLLFVAFISYLFVDPNFFYLKNIYSGIAFKNRQIITFLYLLIILSFFIFYFLFLLLIHRKLINAKDIKLLVVLTAGVLFFAYPAMLSYDIFNYITTAKVLFHYHENPYIVMPIEFANDPYLLFTHAANKIALYGPFWILLSGIPFLLGFGNFLLILFNFKLVIVLFYYGVSYFIWKISKNIFSVVLFSLNPLVVVEALVASHNDIAMMFFTISSFFFLIRKKVGLAVIFFILSIFIKYVTIILIPVFIYTFWQTIRKKTVDWEKAFYYSSLLMLIAFFLSPIREEIYPWYAIWFLPFVGLVHQSKTLLYIALAFSFGLLLRYVPFMLLGTHFGVTPFFKTALTFIPVFFVLIYVFFKDKLWLKIFSRS